MVKREKWGIPLIALVVALQFAALRALPYSTSLFEDMSPEEAVTQSQHPQNGFSIGSVRWDIRRYTMDPHLEPFRIYFRANCYGQRGVAAALCLSDKFAEEFPFGEPSDDFFKADYDPVVSLIAHTQKGEPGHCVTRSGLAAAALLSVGIPALVVQLMPWEGQGHNIFSVWDEKYGWVAVDPSYGCMFADQTRPSSAIEALQSPDMVKCYQLGEEPKMAAGFEIFYQAEKAHLFRGQITYPEPWLYLRTGLRGAYWPFHAKFVHLGTWQWWMGPAQTFLRCGIAICFVLTALSLGVLFNKAVGKYSKQRRPGF